MNRKFIQLVVVALMVVPGASTAMPASATQFNIAISVSGGQKCAKAGSKTTSNIGIPLVCTKKGSKLIWRKATPKTTWSDTQIVFGGYCGQSLTYSRRDKTYSEIEKIELVKTDSSHAVSPLSYSRYSKNLLFETFNCTTSVYSLFTLNLGVKNATPTLIVSLPTGQGISDAIIDKMSGTVMSLNSGNGNDYVVIQYLPSGPVQIWNSKAAGWFPNTRTFPRHLIASTGGQFYIAGSDSGSNSWRMDSVTKYDFSASWISQKVLVGSGSIADVALEDSLAIYTNENLFICKRYFSLSIVDSSTCSTVSGANPSDGQRKIVWALDPKSGGLTSLWVSGNNIFVNPNTLATNSVNLTGCIFGCGMNLVSIDEIGLDLLPYLKTWTVSSDTSFR
jgi:hypothetical protein